MNTTGNFQVHTSFPDDVIKLDFDYFPRPWTKDQWQNLNPSHNHLFSWTKENELLGYALFQYLSGDDTAHLLKILMLPKVRGSGESHAFWGELTYYLRAQRLKNLYLEVEATNAQAIGFYEKCGFNLLRRNKAYYSNGEDALIMSMTL